MRNKSLEQDGDALPDDYPDHLRRPLYKGGEGNPCELAIVGDFEAEHSFSKPDLSRFMELALSSSSSDITESSILGVDQPRLFFDSPQSPLPGATPVALALRRRNVAEEETRNESFHDSESEDIYDLYNACDGIVRNDGLLDIRELDQFSQEDAEALNVVRLKEIWDHTAAGCSTCEEIVRILNSVRGALKADVEDQEQIEALGARIIDSVS